MRPDITPAHTNLATEVEDLALANVHHRPNRIQQLDKPQASPEAQPLSPSPQPAEENDPPRTWCIRSFVGNSRTARTRSWFRAHSCDAPAKQSTRFRGSSELKLADYPGKPLLFVPCERVS